MSLYNYSNCGCGSGSCCGPDNVDSTCSLNSIRKTLIEIINAIKNESALGFNVDVEITTNDGILTVINFSKVNINQIEVTKTTLIADKVAISLCDIAKIAVLTSNTTGSAFNSNLVNSLKSITTSCNMEDTKRSFENCYSCDANGDAGVMCAQGMQNYINDNINSIDTVSYNGNSTQSQSVNLITNITKEDVIKSATLNNQTSNVLATATLQTETAPFVNQVTPTDVDVVSTVTTEDATILQDVTPQTVEVSAPVTTTQKTVVTEVQTQDDVTLVTGVQSTTKNVLDKVSTTTGTVVTGFSGGTPITGVISNVDTVENITPTAVQLPAFTSTGTGELKIKIAARSIDGTNPVSDIDINVTAGDQNISFNGNTQKYVLDDSKNVLGGGTASPSVVSVNQTGTPTTDTFVKTVSSTDIPVIDTITPDTQTGKIVTTVTTEQINAVETQPTTETVVQTLDKTTKDIKSITQTTSVKPTDLLSSTTADALTSATLQTTQDTVLKTSTIATTPITAVTDIQSTQTNIPVPVKEDIDGRVFTAGDGIMGVNNTNGDITIYSICDINTVNTL